MERTLRYAWTFVAAAMATATMAQDRYLDEVFTDDQIRITRDVTYGTNINFMTSDPQANPPVINTIDLKFDVYEPDQTVDSVNERPVMVYVHTGNFLPPPMNGSPTGSKTDSTAVEVCKRFARRGYVAVSMAYRHGWNPLGSSVEIRRGTLLNAVYRSIHDVKQSVRHLRANAAAANDFGIDTDKIVLVGEGSGGYVVQAYVALDRPSEMFISKFRPDPFDATRSYIDTNFVGNIAGFGGALNMYTDNGHSSDVHMVMNLGGALADAGWLNGGEVPLVSFHTVNDPFAPFGDGTVIVPTTGEQVVDVSGSNIAQQLWNDRGNNDAFANITSQDPYTTRARSLYGTTVNGVAISPSPEGLYPIVRPRWPAPAMDESSPWQWWDPNSALATTVIAAGPPPITAHMASMASNPNMSAAKGRAYIDTIMGYSAPRIACVLGLGSCTHVGINERADLAAAVDVFPNPGTDRVTITSGKAVVQRYELRDIQGRLVHSRNVTADRFDILREDLGAGVYMITLHFAEGRATKRVILQ